MHVVIVSSPGMISPNDWKELGEKANIEYIQKDKLTTDDLLSIVEGKDYLVLNREALLSLEISEEFYQKVKERNLPLKAISLDYTGIDWAHPDAAQRYGIVLMNTPYYAALSVAEYALGLIFLHAKKIHQIYSGGIESKPHKNMIVTDKTLGIIGLGHIGEQLAKLARNLGMNVIAWNRSFREIQGVKNVSLEEIFTNSDFISIHLQTNVQTKMLITDELLSKTKRGAIIVNLADRKLINNDYLLHYIQNGQIAGYAIESEEKIEHLISQEPNVSIFPPQAWFTDDSLQKLTKTWIGNILSAIDGNPINVVS